ncbi:MAG TPA: tetratricopeptide repeat protein [Allosphingosinicella sp.]|nr:tetratricopeptide repeat protein [Allosphingosinicella sp.]
MKLLIALALLTAAAAPPAPPASAGQQDQAQVDRAAELIGAGKAADAVALLDALVASQEAQRKNDPRQTYCARSPAEALLYGVEAANEKKAAVVLPQSACYSIFLKGFALIDLNRPDDAKPYLERAVAMAPSNAHFLGELGEWYKNRHDWDQAWTFFQRANDAAALSPKDRHTFDKTRAMRGMGFVLIERGRYDEAEALFRDCLKLNPDDNHAKKELAYIAEHRPKSQ